MLGLAFAMGTPPGGASGGGQSALLNIVPLIFMFGIFYFVQFLIPTFDFFPWSYVRMLSPLLLLWLMWRAARRAGGEAPFFSRVNRWLEDLPSLPALP